ncbi:MAG: recombinase family protein [Actinomycetota bacterium]|nr:recombinase family protein [Actinomycetota bacterium]
MGILAAHVVLADAQRPVPGMLAQWAEGLSRSRPGRRGGGVLRFAFYGRVSTEDWQDPVTSHARQLQQAMMLVAGAGIIVAEFFDIGESRELPWARQPQSAALVAALADPERGWDAIVIGEYERAFYGSQYASMAPLFEHHGVSLWMPEVGGRVDWHAEDHEQTMVALGLSSKRKITRTRVRVRTAMAAQTLEQGRYLGGRPPYGYRLADAGPHPNKAHAAWGRRAHKLEPDPATAPVVMWMFGQRLAGHSAARITRALNDAGVPCPSAADPGRNPHRTRTGWTLRTVAAILANPRYTGRQVWNRQPSEAVLVDPANTGLGHKQVQRWNLPEGWVISKHPAHAALVSEADFIAAQDITAPRGPAGPAARRYLLAGLIACGQCGRRLESCWSNGKPAYRCRHGYSSATAPDPARPKNTCVREDLVLPHLAALAILLASAPRKPVRGDCDLAQLTGPDGTAALIDQLRADGVVLTYDPGGRTLRAGGHEAPSLTVGADAADSHPRQDKVRRTA